MSTENPKYREQFYYYDNYENNFKEIIYFGINPVTKKEVFVDERGVIFTVETGIFKTWKEFKEFKENEWEKQKEKAFNDLKRKFEKVKDTSYTLFNNS